MTNVCRVRLKTSWWKSARGLHERRDVTFLRRQCVGYNVLEEDASAIGVEDVIGRIVDWAVLPDGLYEVTLVNQTHSWENGGVDEYEYQLKEIPHEHPND